MWGKLPEKIIATTSSSILLLVFYFREINDTKFMDMFFHIYFGHEGGNT